MAGAHAHAASGSKTTRAIARAAWRIRKSARCCHRYSSLLAAMAFGCQAAVTLTRRRRRRRQMPAAQAAVRVQDGVCRDYDGSQSRTRSRVRGSGAETGDEKTEGRLRKRRKVAQGTTAYHLGPGIRSALLVCGNLLSIILSITVRTLRRPRYH